MSLHTECYWSLWRQVNRVNSRWQGLRIHNRYLHSIRSCNQAPVVHQHFLLANTQMKQMWHSERTEWAWVASLAQYRKLSYLLVSLLIHPPSLLLWSGSSTLCLRSDLPTWIVQRLCNQSLRILLRGSFQASQHSWWSDFHHRFPVYPKLLRYW